MSVWWLVGFWLLIVVGAAVVLNREPKTRADGLPVDAGSPMAYSPASLVPARPVVSRASDLPKAFSRFDSGSHIAPGAASFAGGVAQTSRHELAAAQTMVAECEPPVRRASPRRKSGERVLLQVHVQHVKEADQPERLRVSSIVVGGQEVMPAHLRPGDVFDERTQALVNSSSRRVSTSRRTASADAGPRPDGVPTRGLVVLAEPLEKILSGRKTLELRSKHNRQLGPVALIRKGSGLIYGVADIVDSVGPMGLDEMLRRTTEHGVEPHRVREVLDKGWNIGWRLANVQRLPAPVPYVHKGMSQVRLDDEAIEKLAHALSGAIRL